MHYTLSAGNQAIPYHAEPHCHARTKLVLDFDNRPVLAEVSNIQVVLLLRHDTSTVFNASIIEAFTYSWAPVKYMCICQWPALGWCRWFDSKVRVNTTLIGELGKESDSRGIENKLYILSSELP